MKFLADEGVDKLIVDGLRRLHYDVWYVVEQAPALDDESILQFANDDQRVLITRDKDFGELVYRLNKAHVGVILIRLDDVNSSERSEIVCKLIQQHSSQLTHAFSVIQKDIIRIR